MSHHLNRLRNEKHPGFRGELGFPRVEMGR